MYDNKRLMMKNTPSYKQTLVSTQFCQSLFGLKGMFASFFCVFLRVNRTDNANDLECQIKIKLRTACVKLPI